MKYSKTVFATILSIVVTFSCCKNLNRTQKGAAIGTAGGAATGAVVGRALGNTALGAIVGAAVGGVTGAIIGKKMDKQAEEMQKNVPNAKIERVGEGIVVEFSEKILFAFDKSDLQATAKSNLDKVIDVLKKYPDTNIEVQGHTDSKGSESYNQKLSVKRASNVSSYLSSNGISSSRLTIKGFGESAPKYSDETAAGQAQNRRVEFLISANEKMKAEADKEAGQ
ncbi:MAG: OmpA family protein [Bacteroidia bacterium]|nr:OmpA family protein [Bacteroidia bacterium]